MDETITRERLVDDLTKLGVQKGDSLNLKISLKSIGYVEGGPATVISAIHEVIGEEGTMVAESFISSHHLSELKRKVILSEEDTPSYAGAIANAMISYPGSVKSKHPIQRFTALGARAQELMGRHTPESYAYDVLKVLSETGGKNLKIGADGKVIGVGTTHVAIGMLNLKQIIPREGIHYRDEEGRIRLFVRMEERIRCRFPASLRLEERDGVAVEQDHQSVDAERRSDGEADQVEESDGQPHDTSPFPAVVDPETGDQLRQREEPEKHTQPDGQCAQYDRGLMPDVRDVRDPEQGGEQEKREDQAQDAVDDPEHGDGFDMSFHG